MRCPLCDRPLTYIESVFGGVKPPDCRNLKLTPSRLHCLRTVTAPQCAAKDQVAVVFGHEDCFRPQHLWKQFAQMLTRISPPSALMTIRTRLAIGAEFEPRNFQVRR